MTAMPATYCVIVENFIMKVREEIASKLIERSKPETCIRDVDNVAPCEVIEYWRRCGKELRCWKKNRSTQFLGRNARLCVVMDVL